MLCFASVSSGDDGGPNGWKRVKTDEAADILIDLRTLADDNVEFRAETTIDTTLGALIALLKDTASLPEWLYRTESAVKLKRVSATESYVYSTHSMPFPLSKRDSIVHTTMTQDPETLSITVRGTASPDYLPEKKGYVRIRDSRSLWRFTPRPDGTVSVRFQGYGDPGGGISDLYRSSLFQWLARSYLWQLPLDTLKNMKEMVKKAPYRGATFPYVREPS